MEGKSFVFCSFAVLLLTTFSVQINAQISLCTFDTDVTDGQQQLDVNEETDAQTELGRYPAVGSVTGVTVASDHPDYLQFAFDPDSKELVVTLLQELGVFLDNDVARLLATVTPICSITEEVRLPVAFTINILDVNNKPIEFNADNFPITIQTPWPAGVPINFNVPIFATDNDYELANADATFTSDNPVIIEIVSTLSQPADGGPKFRHDLQLRLLDPQLGGLAQLDVTITATSTDTLHTDTTVVSLTAEKTNTQPPKLSSTLYQTRGVWEDIPPQNSNVELDITIGAEDPEDSTFVFAVAGPQGHFVNIDAATGQLTYNVIDPSEILVLRNGVAVIHLIARETTTEALSSTATVLIYFAAPGTTVCNYPPKFEQNIYKTRTPVETLPEAGDPVDLDAPITAQDAEGTLFIYEVATGDHAHFVTIDKTTGVLSYTDITEEEVAALPSGIATIEVIARETTTQAPLLSATTVLLYFSLPETSDLPPDFDQNIYETANPVETLPESGEPVDINPPIRAVDHEGAVLDYTVAGQHAHFVKIDSATAVLTFTEITADEVAALPNGVASIEVIAQETGTPALLESSATVLIYFSLPNAERNMPPAFEQNIYETSQIAKLPTVGDPVVLDTPIRAVDPEGKVLVYAVAGPHAHFVAIDSATAALTFTEITAEEVAALSNGVVSIEVIAQEASTAVLLQSSATVLIYFSLPNAESNKPPEFEQNIYETSPIETLPTAGDPVVLHQPIKAVDPDGTVLAYTVAGPYAHFVTIDSGTGALTFNEITNADVAALTNSVASIEVVAQESGTQELLESSATVLIYFSLPSMTDPNLAPYFGQSIYETTNPVETLPEPGDPVEINPPIRAVDPESAALVYTVAGVHSHFVNINSSTAVLTFTEITSEEVAALPNGVASIEVRATESGTPIALETSATVLIYFQISDEECEETIGFIIALAILALLFVIALLVAIYFWHKQRTVSSSMSNLIRVDDVGLTPPPPFIEQWEDTARKFSEVKLGNGLSDVGKIPTSDVGVVAVAQLYAPDNPVQEAVNTPVVNGKSGNGAVYDMTTDPEEEGEYVDRDVVERPPSPKPDYRLKPDFSVQIQDAVQVFVIPDSSSDSETDADQEKHEAEVATDVQDIEVSSKTPEKVETVTESNKNDDSNTAHASEDAEKESNSERSDTERNKAVGSDAKSATDWEVLRNAEIEPEKVLESETERL